MGSKQDWGNNLKGIQFSELYYGPDSETDEPEFPTLPQITAECEGKGEIAFFLNKIF